MPSSGSGTVTFKGVVAGGGSRSSSVKMIPTFTLEEQASDPTPNPTKNPTAQPSPQPSVSPTVQPSVYPSPYPSPSPTFFPSGPSVSPTPGAYPYTPFTCVFAMSSNLHSHHFLKPHTSPNVANCSTYTDANGFPKYFSPIK